MRYKKPLVLMLIWALLLTLAPPAAAEDPVVLVDGEAYGFHSFWTVELTDAATGMVHEVGQTIGLHDRSRERRVTNFVPFDEAKAWVESLHGSWQFVQDHGAWVTIEAGGLSGQYIRLRDLVKYSGGNVDAYDSINTRVTVTATQPPGAQIDLSNLIVTLDKGCSWRLFIDDKLVASGVCESELDLGKYLPPGEHDVRLEIIDDKGRTTIVEETLTGPNKQPAYRNLSPIAVITMPATVYRGEQLEIRSDSYDPDGEIVEQTWSVEPAAAMNGTLLDDGGIVSFEEVGVYKITLTVKDNAGATASTTKTLEVLKNVPVASFTMADEASPLVPVTVIHTSKDIDNLITDVAWAIEPAAAVTAQLGDNGGHITFNQPGSYVVTLTITDSDGDIHTCERSIEIINLPPVAIIEAPNQVIQGEDLVIKSLSFDPDTPIVSLDWSVEPAAAVIGQLAGEQSTIYFDEPGSYVITLTVTDLFGDTDTTTATIEVTQAVPVAIFDIAEGTLKENRRLVLDAGQSSGSDRYPVDFSQTQWEFIPPAGVDADAAKVVAGGPEERPEMTFKAPGPWVVRVAVKNSKGTQSPWYEQALTIEPDLEPVADFRIVAKAVTRDPVNQNKAAVELIDQSVSPDGDLIARRLWKYRYDTENKGNFEGEPWQILSDGNDMAVRLETTEVGRYEFALEVEEAPGEAIIPEFWDAAVDLRRSSAAPQGAEVVNEPPEAHVSFNVVSDLDVVIHGIFGTNGDNDGFENNGNSLVNKIGNAGVSVKSAIFKDEATVTYRKEIEYIGGACTASNCVATNPDGVINRDSNTQWTVDLRRVLQSPEIDYTSIYVDINWPGYDGGYDIPSSQHPIIQASTDGRSWRNLATRHLGGMWGGDWIPTASFGGIGPFGSFTGAVRYVRVISQNERIAGLSVIPTKDRQVSQFEPPVLNDSLVLDYLTNFSWRDSSERYVVLITDVVPSLSDVTNVVNQYNALDSKVVFVGTSSTQAVGEKLTAGTGGQFIPWNGDPTSIPWDQIQATILADLPTNLPPDTVMVGQQVEYETSFIDPNNDPKQAEKWIYWHEDFDPATGQASFHGQELSSPITVFDKPGIYRLQYQAQNNPKDDPRFANYWLWSPMAEKFLYVIEAQGTTTTGTAKTLFTVGQNPLPQGNAFTYSDLSYDPAGIVEKRWRVRTPAGEWLDFGGSPPNFSGLPLGDYLVELRVRNGLGEWSEPATQTVTVGP